MKDLIDSIGKFLSGLIKEKKIGGISTIVLFVILVFFCFEYSTGFLYYRDINNKISVIERIQELRESDLPLSSDLNDEIIEIEKGLGERKTINLQNCFRGVNFSEVNFWKIFTSGGIWVILGIIAVFGFLGNDNMNKAVGFILIIFGCLISFLSHLIPNIFSMAWINSVLYFLGNVFIILLISKKGKKVKKKNETTI